MGRGILGGLFGRSPFRPMQEHMEIVAQCAAQVAPLIDAVVAGDISAVEAAKDRIFEIEQQADDAKNEIRAHLPKSLLMPVDRRDLLEILHAQDSIADTAQDIAGLCVMRELAVPEPFQGLLQEYVQSSLAAVKQCQTIINELDELLETGFRGRSVDRVEAMIAELARVETAGDAQGMELTSRLFQIDAGMSPGTFFLWHELFERIGDLADYAQDVGNQLRLLIAR